MEEPFQPYYKTGYHFLTSVALQKGPSVHGKLDPKCSNFHYYLF